MQLSLISDNINDQRIPFEYLKATFASILERAIESQTNKSHRNCAACIIKCKCNAHKKNKFHSIEIIFIFIVLIVLLRETCQKQATSFQIVKYKTKSNSTKLLFQNFSAGYFQMSFYYPFHWFLGIQVKTKTPSSVCKL